MLESSLRPLTAAERRLLRARARELESRERGGPRTLALGVAVIAILWALTVIASDTPWPIVTLFWVLVGAAILLWVRRGLHHDLGRLRDMSRRYRSALRRNEGEVFRIQAKSFAEFEEVEDEGACYAFQLDGDRLAFVVGQGFYPRARFPSHDFSLVYPLDENGASIDMMIEKRGPRATAARTIPAATKLGLDLPEHLEVRKGGLEDLDEILRSRS